jgi:uncharacterized protein (TIGR03435 family)
MLHRIGVCLLFSLPLLSQGPAKVSSDLRFEVVSLKPSKEQPRNGGMRRAPGGERYEAANCPIDTMIQAAYRVIAAQIVGAPAWLSTEEYDMQAKAEKPSSVAELDRMLKNMLEDRLQLKVHHERREMPMYALTVDKDGPHLMPHAGPTSGDPSIVVKPPKFWRLRLTATNAPIDYFAFVMSEILDLPVVDLTNMRGGYDFTLEFNQGGLPSDFPAGGKINGREPDTSGPSIFAAAKQQLGLSLKRQKGPVDVLVIDRVEKPTAN